MNVGELNQKLCKKYPDFNVANYGYAKLSRMLGDFKECKITNFGKIITLRS